MTITAAGVKEAIVLGSRVMDKGRILKPSERKR